MSGQIRNNNLPMYSVAFLMFVSVGRLHELIPGLSGLPIGKLAIVAAIVGVFSMNLKEKQLFAGLPSPIVNRVALIFFLAVILTAISINKSVSFNLITGNLLSTIILFYVIVKTATNERVVGFYIKCLVFAGSVHAVSAISSEASGRVSVITSQDPNDLAMVLVTILPLAYILLAKEQGKWKVYYGVLISVMAIAIMLTGSRGGFIGLVAVGAFVLFASDSGVTRGKTKINKTILVAAAALLLLFFTPSSYWDRISTTFDTENNYNYTADGGRIALWGTGLELMMKYPYGLGVGTFEIAQGQLMGGRYQAAHNSLILIGVELGVLALIVYLSLFMLSRRILKNISRSESRNLSNMRVYAYGVHAAILGFFVTSFFLSQSYSPLFYTLLAITQAMSFIAGNDNKKDVTAKQSNHSVDIKKRRDPRRLAAQQEENG